MKSYTFAYGDGTVEARLDESGILGVLQGNSVPGTADIRETLFHALEEPVDSAPLSALLTGKEKIALIVSDLSRFWMRQDLVIPHAVDYLTDRCRIPAENICIVVANGTHPGGNENELRQIVTDGVYDRIRVVNHDCMADNLVFIGTTSRGTEVRIAPEAAEADFVIALGAAAHHSMAGYGGGRKSILPGISAMDTICHNHAFCLADDSFRSNPLIGNGVLDGNPVNEDMCEAAGFLPKLFMINLVLNADMQLAKVFAGHYISSWLRACEAVDRIYSVRIPEKADAVIASCGGYPKDMSLYQGTKTIDNVETCLKPGGTLILIIEAREGGGPEEYFGWGKSLLDGTMEEKLRSRFTVPGYAFLLTCEQAQRYRIMLLTTISQKDVSPMGIEAYSDFEALLDAADLNGKTLYLIPNGATVIPRVSSEP